MAAARTILASQKTLIKSALFSGKIKPQALTSVRNGSGRPLPWNYLWRPDLKEPKTDEEKAKAAAKYGLIPEDYQTYGEEGHFHGCMNMGDYPKVKPRGGDERPGWYNYDIPAMKRDFGEVMHPEHHWFEDTRSDTGRKIWPAWKGFCSFLAIYFTMWALWIGIDKIFERRFPIMEEQLPKNGKHYTFEKAE